VDGWVEELKAQLETHDKVVIRDLESGEEILVEDVRYDSDENTVVIEV
jgi:hypothetical protein